MTSRWERLENVYHAARELDGEARVRFLDERCGSDRAMRQHIDVLLAQNENPTSFLNPPATDVRGVRIGIVEPVGGLTGFRVGAYEVLELIGCGGMGEVYRAHDAVLARDIALKVLPHPMTLDSNRIARFKREAQILASLNHPHIAAIYGFEESIATSPRGSGGGEHRAPRLIRALALELVEGSTLADRIAQGPLPVDQAISVAHQIVAALSAAHARGIVHRDLKPANVKLRPDHTVKVLDFGLATVLEQEDEQPGDARSPAATTPTITEVGVVLGTPGYMSPEQLRGAPADKRSDIWAFGCVLYEMLSGIRPFRADDPADTLAAVLRGDPDWSALPATVPHAVRVLIRGCLQKDPAQRVGDITTAQFAFDHAADFQPVTPPGSPRTVKAPVAVSAALSALAAALLVWAMVRAPTPSRTLARFTIQLPAGERFSNTGVHAVALSRDGTRLAYAANLRLYLRPIDQLEPVLVPGTEAVGTAAARGPFFSPDGQWIGFWQSGQLKKVAVTGGPPIVLCGAQNPWGASWNTDNSIVFGQDEDGLGPGIFTVSGDGGRPQQILKVDRGQVAANPQLLPGGQEILFTLVRRGDWNTAQIAVQRIGTGERHIVLERGMDARYTSTGHLVYALNETLLAVPFDLATLTVTGGPVPLVERNAAQNVTAQFDISQRGTLVYVPGDEAGSGLPPRRLSWIDRHGLESPVNAPPRLYMYPRLSPDGTHVAVEIRAQDGDIWLWDLGRETLTRVTFGPLSDQYPVWMPDGRSLVFGRSPVGGPRAPRSFFRQPADGTGAAERLLEGSVAQFPSAVTPDGRALIFRRETPPATIGDAPGMDLFLLPLTGDHRARPLVATPFDELNGEVSPDGRWLAYQSNESGRYEIYVRPFPDVNAGKWQVSTKGGTQPLWARDGHELFYETAEVLMSVPLRAGVAFEAGIPIKIADTPPLTAADALAGNATPPGRMYDASPDGRRFLMIRASPPATEPSSSRLVFVQNWFEELQRRVPAK